MSVECRTDLERAEDYLADLQCLYLNSRFAEMKSVPEKVVTIYEHALEIEQLDRFFDRDLSQAIVGVKKMRVKSLFIRFGKSQ